MKKPTNKQIATVTEIAGLFEGSAVEATAYPAERGFFALEISGAGWHMGLEIGRGGAIRGAAGRPGHFGTFPVTNRADGMALAAFVAGKIRG